MVNNAFISFGNSFIFCEEVDQKCYVTNSTTSFCLLNSFFPPQSPLNLTYFPDYVRNPDERPMSVSIFTSGVSVLERLAIYCSHRCFRWASFAGS